jgi:hypothetical protein
MSAPTNIIVKVTPANEIPPIIKIQEQIFKTEVK